MGEKKKAHYAPERRVFTLDRRVSSSSFSRACVWGSSLLLVFQEAKSHIQELSIKTTIISRYAFTAVHCAMLNRYSAAAEGLFQFQIPAGAYISNFTM